MSTPTQATGSGVVPYRLSVRQFKMMIDAGIFPEKAHVELLGGRLVDKMTKHPPHDFTVGRFSSALRELLPADWFVREEKSLQLGGFWRPEPDIAVVRGPDALYSNRDPNAVDVALIVEVADSSYAKDHGLKWRAYAAARIPVYLIVRLAERRVEVHRNPSGRGRQASYQDVETYLESAEVPIVIDGVEVGRLAVRDLLP
ncbi:MAG: Uma2 family endonuclease [Isosphaeraceae bacterium]